MNIRDLLKRVIAVVLVSGMTSQGLGLSPQVVVSSDAAPLRSSLVLPGQTVTLLPNGSWLVLGGEGKKGPIGTAILLNPNTGAATPLNAALSAPRAWHIATVLPDGTVLVLGGQGANGDIVSQAELFDPSLLSFRAVQTGLIPRAHFAAALLTDGRLLVVGGIGADQHPVNQAELWDSRTKRITPSQGEPVGGRFDDRATVQADGTVLFWGGTDPQGNKAVFAEIYDPALDTFRAATTVSSSQPDLNLPFLEASLPDNGAVDVPLDVMIGLRFSKTLRPRTVNPATISFQSSAGFVPATIVPAEGGRLAFVTPKSPLLPGTEYSLTLQGPSDGQGLNLVYRVVSFTTVDTSNSKTNPDSSNTSSDTASKNLAPLQAPRGVTAVAGQALRLNGKPLPNVTFKIDNKSVRSDRTGRFLLANVSSGHHALVIDGRSARTANQSYGVFETGVDLPPGQTTALSYKIWMTELDTIHAVHVQFPTTDEVVITNPLLPGLEFRIPPKTIITDIDGKMAKEISITPIPLDRPPFPLPWVQVPIYFTIQPGGGYIQVSGTGPKGATLIYPNTYHLTTGSRIDFWNYDPDTTRGWFVYGQGTVAPNGQSIVPDAGVVLYELTGAMVGGPGWGPPNGPPSGGGGGGGGDPVDLSTGLFIYNKTDLYLPDIMPINLTRTYRQNDTMSRAFGIGATHPYDMFIAGNLNDFSYVELVMGNGGRIRFDRTSGNIWSSSTLQCISTPGPFYGALFTSQSPGWRITLRDGTQYGFLQPGLSGPFKYQDTGLVSIIDRHGNTLRIVRDSNNYITGIVSPNGRWVSFNNDTNHRISVAQDNLGRTVQYFYDTPGHLTQVIDANGGIWTYGWDPTHTDQMTSITDPRQIQFITNQYDANDRVSRQVGADPSIVYQFSYVSDSFNNIGQTTVTDPNGNVRQINYPPPPSFPDGVYRSGAYMSTDTWALGKPEQQTFSYQRDPTSGFLQSILDPLQRQTTLTHDNFGNLTTITQLAGTPNAVTTHYSYETTFNQLAGIVDPLGHTTVFGHDNSGNVTSVTDPVGNAVTYAYNTVGHMLSATDPLGNTWHFSYLGSDIAGVVDPLGNSVSLLTDGGGRVVSVTDPLGRTTRLQYNALNRVTQVTDALGGITSFTYDQNGRLSSVTDPRNGLNPTTYTYDIFDHLQKRTDPLGAIETFGYDPNGNLTCFTDRRGKISVFNYDGLDRRTFSGYGATSCGGGSYESSTSYSWDPGDRPTVVSDSSSGTLTPVFDGLDRLQSETSSSGSVSYQYDAASRPSTMTVTGQPLVQYTFDNANRITQIAQGAASVNFGYDASSRRTSLSLPNGISVAYTYDSNSRLTSLAYQNGATILGNLTYGYDQAGRVSQVGGSYARTNLPAPLSAATYDIANRLTSWGTNSSYTYDANGNMTGDGANIYTWDARNQLATIAGAVNANFQYDPLGRRVGKTIATTSTGFLYDGFNTVQELSGNTPTANLLTGGTDEIFTRSDTTTSTFLTDPLGSTLALTDNTGTPTTQYTYEPFGNTATGGNSSGNPTQYTGRENDGTGLYYYRARYYHPTLQRFISQDPIGFRGGDANLYAYAANSPTNLVDPNGQQGAEGVLAPPLIAAGPWGWLALGGIVLADIGMGYYLYQHSQADSPAIPDATTADPNGRKGDPPKKDPCKSTPNAILGHYTDYYSEVAQQLGSQAFDIGDAWNSMSQAERWAANQAFLDEIIGQGGAFGLVTPLGKVRDGSYLQKEIQYLMDKGYKLGCNGTTLLPPG